jgi:hypothetical protein
MSNADEWFLSMAFGVVTAILWAMRERLKRIEEKLDKMSGK